MNEQFKKSQEEAPDRPPLREVSREELERILEVHQKWVESGLTPSQVKEAENWQPALYSNDFLKRLGLPPDHNDRVKKKLAELGKERKATGAE